MTLTIKRGSVEKDIAIKRDTIHVKSVEYEKKTMLASLQLTNSKTTHQAN